MDHRKPLDDPRTYYHGDQYLRSFVELPLAQNGYVNYLLKDYAKLLAKRVEDMLLDKGLPEDMVLGEVMEYLVPADAMQRNIGGVRDDPQFENDKKRKNREHRLRMPKAKRRRTS